MKPIWLFEFMSREITLRMDVSQHTTPQTIGVSDLCCYVDNLLLTK